MTPPDDPASDRPTGKPLVPEEAISQPLSDDRELGTPDPAALRATYGRVRAFVKARPERFRAHRRRLKQARVRDTYDVHLAASVRLALLAAAVGGVGGLLVAAIVLWIGLPSDVLGPVDAGVDDPATGTALVTALGLSVPGALGAGLGVPLVRAYRLRRVIANRRRSIDHNLPYAIMFAYALSRGGMNFLDVCRRLADAPDMYGEVANEFDMLVREIDLFGNGLLRALENVQTVTPSDSFRRFLDDLLSVLESGGDLETFLETETEKYLETAQEEQEAFVGTLGTLSELFVVAFVAAPLFLIVVLMVVSFLGAHTLWIIALLVYGAFPIGMVGFLLALHWLSRAPDSPSIDVAPDPGRSEPTDPRVAAYRSATAGVGIRAFLSGWLQAVRRRPVLSLWVTLPAGIGVAGLGIAAGVVQPTVPAFVASPTRTTTGLVVVPLLTAVVPLTVLHRRERRRTRRITQRLPDVLGILSNANEMGVKLVDGCDLVTRWGSGILAEEFQKVRNDLAWNLDIERALLALAGRLAVPQLTRTMTLIAVGSRASGDLHSLLEIAAADTRARAKLARARRREVDAYVVIVVIGFLVYLLVIVMVSASYLAPISDLTAGAGPPDQPEALAGVGAVPVGTYRMLFLHSALVQGFGSGLIAGKLADNDVRSGLTYGIALVLVTVVAFAVFV